MTDAPERHGCGLFLRICWKTLEFQAFLWRFLNATARSRTKFPPLGLRLAAPYLWAFLRRTSCWTSPMQSGGHGRREGSLQFSLQQFRQEAQDSRKI